MKPKEFIAKHKVAVDYNNGVSVPMIAISNAEKAIALAEHELAKDLLKLHESARIEYLEKIVMNYENKK